MTVVRSEFPLAVKVVDTVWITMPDGMRLATTLWLPVTDAKVPVVVELIPYRRRDGTVFRDVELHPYLAGNGVAYVRVDLRGSGDSDGLLRDEYTQQEQADCCFVIDWLSKQDWCNGSVGMCGISWGGFNALQVAALQPPALKAIITLCASDDRHSDDVHYMGGAMLTENISWSNVMMSMNALPPDPRARDDWREVWQARLEANSCWAERWITHATRDGYWQQGSVSQDYSKVKIPVLAGAGWDDSYSNFVMRLLENLSGPRLGILGPWSHAFPCRGAPGPHIGWLQECLRWWKHWLGGEATGIMDEPMLRVWVSGQEEPAASYEVHQGRWVGERVWPSGNVRKRTLYLSDGLLGDAAGGEVSTVKSPATAGIECGRWGGYGGGAPDLPLDQRREDARALCFDTVPLDAPLTLIGGPVLQVDLVSDQPLGHLIARLCVVAPDGTSSLACYGVLNLARRNGMDRNDPMPVVEAVRVRLRLDDLARDVPAGYRLRLAISNQHWPILWPQPSLATYAISNGVLTLPVHQGDEAVTWQPPENAPSLVTETLSPSESSRVISHDVGRGEVKVTLREHAGATLIVDRGIAVFDGSNEIYTIHADDPLCASMTSETLTGTKSGPVDASVLARTSLSADATHFNLSWLVETRDHGEIIHRMEGSKRLPRGGL